MFYTAVSLKGPPTGSFALSWQYAYSSLQKTPHPVSRQVKFIRTEVEGARGKHFHSIDHFVTNGFHSHNVIVLRLDKLLQQHKLFGWHGDRIRGNCLTQNVEG